jgi:3-deoxy-D-manno-octulosonate 8-phosphate phosphatase (KDO 8-P phosphatase)
MSKKNPSVFIIDVDGVLTDGKFYYSADGKMFKVFGPDDHDALKLLVQHLEIVFVTGDKLGFPISQARIVKDMGMRLELVSTTKRAEWIEERWDTSQVIYMGDGIFDHYVFKKVAYSIAPANSDILAKQHANYVTHRSGGDRAVAEACRHITERFFEMATSPVVSLKSEAIMNGEWGQ